MSFKLRPTQQLAIQFVFFFLAAALIAMCSLEARADPIVHTGIALKDEGVTKGPISTLNCVGTSVACTRAGANGTLTVTANSEATSGPTINFLPAFARGFMPGQPTTSGSGLSVFPASPGFGNIGNAPTTSVFENSRAFAVFTTTTSAANNSGVANGSGFKWWNMSPLFYAVVKTGPDVTEERMWAGFVSTTPINDADAPASTTAACVFRYSTAASDTNWMAATRNGDGTAQVVTSTGIAVQADTVYTMVVDHRTAGQCDFYINGTLVVSKTGSSVPPGTSATNAFGVVQVTNKTTSATAKTIKVARYYYDGN